MQLSEILDREWVPALGCTEPASIALAAAHAASLADGPVRAVHLVCDPRLYKNCYAVGIPNSGRKSGILWAIAIGASLPDPSAGLECFGGITPEVLAAAEALLAAKAVTVEVDSRHAELHADCQVVRSGGVGRAVLAREHTRLVHRERDGRPLPVPADAAARPAVGPELSQLGLDELVEIAAGCTALDRGRLFAGAERNLAIARHGLSLLPQPF